MSANRLTGLDLNEGNIEKPLLRYSHIDNRRQKPVLDEKRLAEFVRVIGVSMFTEKPVKIKLYREEQDVQLIGLIDKVATDSRQLKIGFENTYEWITLDDVIEMKIVL